MYCTALNFTPSTESSPLPVLLVLQVPEDTVGFAAVAGLPVGAHLGGECQEQEEQEGAREAGVNTRGDKKHHG